MSNLNVEFCCTCLSICAGGDKFLSLSFSAPHAPTYKNKLKSCIPEMGLQNSDEFFLCKPCSIALENAYNFRCMCVRSAGTLAQIRNLKRQNVKDISGIREDLLQLLSRDDLKRSTVQIPRLLKNSAGRSVLEQVVVDDVDDIVSHSKIDTVKELGSLLTESLGSGNIAKGSVNILKSLNAKIVKIKKLPSYSVLQQTTNGVATEISDEELIQLSRRRIPELRNVPAESLQCRVSLEKILVKESPVIVPSTPAKRSRNVKQKESFYCKVCDKTLTKRESYYAHVLLHANIRAYKCNLCTSGYFSADSLRVHKRKSHPVTPQQAPKIVIHSNKIVSKTQPPVVANVKQTSKVKNTRKRPRAKSILKIKLNSGGNKPNKPSTITKNDTMYHCDSCNYKTLSKYFSELHSLKHSTTANFTCTICSKAYYAQWELNRHIRSTHNESVVNSSSRRAKAPPAKKIKTELATDDTLITDTSRELKNLNSTEDELGCTICGQTFYQEKQFKLHLQTHRLDVQQPNTSATTNGSATQTSTPNTTTTTTIMIKQNKKYFCTICNAEFRRRDHENVHTGAKPYSCDICGKTFSAYGSVGKHKNSVHRQVKDIPQASIVAKPRPVHECEICKQQFEKADDVYLHDCQTASGESVYRCQICKNAYLGRTALIEHMRVHVGESEAAP